MTGALEDVTQPRLAPPLIAWYRDNEAWWAPQKEATEAKYRQAGQA